MATDPSGEALARRLENAEAILAALDRQEADVVVSRDGVLLLRSKAHAESEKRFRLMADNAPILIWVCGPDKGCTWINRRMADFTGRSLDEFCGEGWTATVHPDDRERAFAAFSEAFDRREDFETEYRARHADGHYRWLATHGVPYYGTDGAFLGYIGSCVDHTARRTAIEQLAAARDAAERANKAKSRFLAAASHDLRQPLAALALYVGMLESKMAAKDAGLVDNIRGCVDSLSELLTDLLDVSKLDAGVIKPEIASFPVAEMLARLVAQHSTEAQLKGLELRSRVPPLIARSDPVLFSRIVGNLFANAVRHTERGGVLVACRRRNGKMWVEVWDTGVGIPEDMIRAVFEEYRQLGNGTRQQGSGLGLAIVEKTANLLGVAIRVRSRPGRGSLFAVELPLGRESEIAAPLVASPERSRRLRIALVDDNSLVLDALSYTLGSAGHEVVAAVSLDEIVARLGTRAPDLVISDYRLAGTATGYDAIEAVRRVFGERVPAIIITGDTEPAIIARMAQRGVSMLHKPIALAALNARIAEITAG